MSKQKKNNFRRITAGALSLLVTAGYAPVVAEPLAVAAYAEEIPGDLSITDYTEREAAASGTITASAAANLSQVTSGTVTNQTDVEITSVTFAGTADAILNTGKISQSDNALTATVNFTVNGDDGSGNSQEGTGSASVTFATGNVTFGGELGIGETTKLYLEATVTLASGLTADNVAVSDNTENVPSGTTVTTEINTVKLRIPLNTVTTKPASGDGYVLIRNAKYTGTAISALEGAEINNNATNLYVPASGITLSDLVSKIKFDVTSSENADLDETGKALSDFAQGDFTAKWYTNNNGTVSEKTVVTAEDVKNNDIQLFVAIVPKDETFDNTKWATLGITFKKDVVSAITPKLGTLTTKEILVDSDPVTIESAIADLAFTVTMASSDTPVATALGTEYAVQISSTSATAGYAELQQGAQVASSDLSGTPKKTDRWIRVVKKDDKDVADTSWTNSATYTANTIHLVFSEKAAATTVALAALGSSETGYTNPFKTSYFGQSDDLVTANTAQNVYISPEGLKVTVNGETIPLLVNNGSQKDTSGVAYRAGTLTDETKNKLAKYDLVIQVANDKGGDWTNIDDFVVSNITEKATYTVRVATTNASTSGSFAGKVTVTPRRLYSTTSVDPVAVDGDGLSDQYVITKDGDANKGKAQLKIVGLKVTPTFNSTLNANPAQERTFECAANTDADNYADGKTVTDTVKLNEADFVSALAKAGLKVQYRNVTNKTKNPAWKDFVPQTTYVEPGTVEFQVVATSGTYAIDGSGNDVNIDPVPDSTNVAETISVKVKELKIESVQYGTLGSDGTTVTPGSDKIVTADAADRLAGSKQSIYAEYGKDAVVDLSALKLVAENEDGSKTPYELSNAASFTTLESLGIYILSTTNNGTDWTKVGGKEIKVTADALKKGDVTLKLRIIQADSETAAIADAKSATPTGQQGADVTVTVKANKIELFKLVPGANGVKIARGAAVADFVKAVNAAGIKYKAVYTYDADKSGNAATAFTHLTDNDAKPLTITADNVWGTASSNQDATGYNTAVVKAEADKVGKEAKVSILAVEAKDYYETASGKTLDDNEKWKDDLTVTIADKASQGVEFLKADTNGILQVVKVDSVRVALNSDFGALKTALGDVVDKVRINYGGNEKVEINVADLKLADPDNKGQTALEAEYKAKTANVGELTDVVLSASGIDVPLPKVIVYNEPKTLKLVEPVNGNPVFDTNGNPVPTGTFYIGGDKKVVSVEDIMSLFKVEVTYDDAKISYSKDTAASLATLVEKDFNFKNVVLAEVKQGYDAKGNKIEDYFTLEEVKSIDLDDEDSVGLHEYCLAVKSGDKLYCLKEDATVSAKANVRDRGEETAPSTPGASAKDKLVNTFTISVAKPAVAKIEITKQPDKLYYGKGVDAEKVDLKGAVVTISYVDAEKDGLKEKVINLDGYGVPLPDGAEETRDLGIVFSTDNTATNGVGNLTKLLRIGSDYQDLSDWFDPDDDTAGGSIYIWYVSKYNEDGSIAEIVKGGETTNNENEIKITLDDIDGIDFATTTIKKKVYAKDDLDLVDADGKIKPEVLDGLEVQAYRYDDKGNKVNVGGVISAVKDGKVDSRFTEISPAALNYNKDSKYDNEQDVTFTFKPYDNAPNNAVKTGTYKVTVPVVTAKEVEIVPNEGKEGMVIGVAKDSGDADLVKAINDYVSLTIKYGEDSGVPDVVGKPVTTDMIKFTETDTIKTSDAYVKSLTKEEGEKTITISVDGVEKEITFVVKREITKVEIVARTTEYKLNDVKFIIGRDGDIDRTAITNLFKISATYAQPGENGSLVTEYTDIADAIARDPANFQENELFIEYTPEGKDKVTTKVTTDYKLEVSAKNKGAYTVKFNYKPDKPATGDFIINIAAPTVTSMKITPPTKGTYTSGVEKNVDLTGASLEVTYSPDDKIPVTTIDLSSAETVEKYGIKFLVGGAEVKYAELGKALDGKSGDVVFEVDYLGEKQTFKITVLAVSDIKFESMPKTEYTTADLKGSDGNLDPKKLDLKTAKLEVYVTGSDTPILYDIVGEDGKWNTGIDVAFDKTYDASKVKADKPEIVGVNVTFGGKTASFTIQVTQSDEMTFAKVDKLTVTKKPTTASYILGDAAIDDLSAATATSDQLKALLAGTELEVTYTQGDPKTVDITDPAVEAKVTQGDFNKTGPVIITLTYTENGSDPATATVELTVRASNAKVSGIVLKTKPTVASYALNDVALEGIKVDDSAKLLALLSGAVIKVTYTDENTAEVPVTAASEKLKASVESGTFTAPGEVVILLTYQEEDDAAFTLPVTVTITEAVEATVKNIDVKLAKSSFTVDEVAAAAGDYASLLAGSVVTVNYETGTPRVINDIKDPRIKVTLQEGDPTKAGTLKLLVTYTEAGKDTEKTVSVTLTQDTAEKKLTGIKVDASALTDLKVGSTLNAGKLVINKVFSDDSTEKLALTDVAIEVTSKPEGSAYTGADATFDAAGNYTFTVKYKDGEKELTDTFTVKVSANIVYSSLTATPNTLNVKSDDVKDVKDDSASLVAFLKAQKVTIEAKDSDGNVVADAAVTAKITDGALAEGKTATITLSVGDGEAAKTADVKVKVSSSNIEDGKSQVTDGEGNVIEGLNGKNVEEVLQAVNSGAAAGKDVVIEFAGDQPALTKADLKLPAKNGPKSITLKSADGTALKLDDKVTSIALPKGTNLVIDSDIQVTSGKKLTINAKDGDVTIKGNITGAKAVVVKGKKGHTATLETGTYETVSGFDNVVIDGEVTVTKKINIKGSITIDGTLTLDATKSGSITAKGNLAGSGSIVLNNVNAAPKKNKPMKVASLDADLSLNITGANDAVIPTGTNLITLTGSGKKTEDPGDKIDVNDSNSLRNEKGKLIVQ